MSRTSRSGRTRTPVMAPQQWSIDALVHADEDSMFVRAGHAGRRRARRHRRGHVGRSSVHAARSDRRPSARPHQGRLLRRRARPIAVTPRYGSSVEQRNGTSPAAPPRGGARVAATHVAAGPVARSPAGGDVERELAARPHAGARSIHPADPAGRDPVAGDEGQRRRARGGRGLRRPRLRGRPRRGRPLQRRGDRVGPSDQRDRSVADDR